jgi:spore coat protein A
MPVVLFGAPDKMTDRLAHVTRRDFLQKSGMLVAGFSTCRFVAGQVNPRTGTIARPMLGVNTLARFVDPLPIPVVLKPSGTRPSPDAPSSRIPYYRLAMRELQSKVHRDVKRTRTCGFGQSSPGPTFETRSGEPLLVEWANELPTSHFLPIDHGVHGAEADKLNVRAVTHLHGAKAPAKSDGYPEAWWVPGKSALYYYPNHQDAAMLWYHDHALGITRLNMYAGLFGAFVIRDEFEDGLNLPRASTRFR